MPFARQARSGHTNLHSPRGAVSSADLARLLRSNIPAAGFVDRLKIGFRPYICPFDLLLPHVEPRESYYDIGCGSGMFLRILAEYKNPTALGGTEISAHLIENAAAVLNSCHVPLALSVYDGCDFPGEVAEYQWVFLIDVLHHVPRASQSAFLSRLFARLLPGQQLLIKDIDAASPLVYWNKLHDFLLSKEIGHEWSATATQRELERIGFEVRPLFNTQVFLYPHFALLCTKPRGAAVDNHDSKSGLDR
jgi:2-polyprenyl-3-methyl-5-hydroxy-6-metoxy-1,4-benzoquinol methylase